MFGSTRYDQLAVRLIGLIHGDTLRLTTIHDIDKDEQQVALTACRSTGMTPERWDALNEAAREPWLEEAIRQLRDAQPTEPEYGGEEFINSYLRIEHVSDSQPRIEQNTFSSQPCGEPALPTYNESLSSKEFEVLRTLQKEHPCRVLLVDLAAKSRIGGKTCGQIVKSLVQRGLAERKSERTGVTITPKGQKLLAIDRPINASLNAS